MRGSDERSGALFSYVDLRRVSVETILYGLCGRSSIKRFRKKDGGNRDDGRTGSRRPAGQALLHGSCADGEPPGLAVVGGVSQATGTAERDEALALVDRRRRRRIGG